MSHAQGRILLLRKIAGAFVIESFVDDVVGSKSERMCKIIYLQLSQLIPDMLRVPCNVDSPEKPAKFI